MSRRISFCADVKLKDFKKDCLNEAFKFQSKLPIQTEFMKVGNHLGYLKATGRLGTILEDNEKFDFAASEIDPKTFKIFKRHDFQRYGQDLVLSNAEKLRYFIDCLPRVESLSAQVQANYGSCKSLFGHGQAINPQDTLSSPKITIEAPDGLYTLLLTDLDRPNLETKSLQEFCHWMITDLQVKDESLEIPSIPSKYIKSGDSSSTSNAASIPGNVVFEYLPIHPALSNPKSLRRYQISLWRQPAPLKISKSEWKSQSENERKESLLLPPHSRLTETEREIELEIRERSIPLPTLAFATKHNLTLSGLYIFTSTFNIYTPTVFDTLGLHQPVYGQVRKQHIPHLLRKIDASVDIAKEGLENLPAERLKKMNHGYGDVLPQPRLPTRRDLRVTVPVEESPSVGLKKSNGRIKRLTVYGAVGLVRNNKNDVAFGFEGVVRKKGDSAYLNA